MENKQLQEELYKAIDESENMDWYTNVDEASKACSVITLKHMKGFSEWASRDWWSFHMTEDIWYNIGKNGTTRGIKTTEELIELYFESLNK